MFQQNNLFYAKILLFGEYSVLLGSDALTVPYSHFNGRWSFAGSDHYTRADVAQASHQALGGLKDYLARLQDERQLPVRFHTEALTNDLKSGLYFESNIPQGYGLGSSGALIAALYNRYATNPGTVTATMSPEALDRLKALFAKLENYYHGTSSGLDPLNAYVKTPLHVKGKQILQTQIPVHNMQQQGGIFLLNTRRPRKTGPLVEYFMKHTREKGERHIPPKTYQKLTQDTLNAFISGQAAPFQEAIRDLSDFQLRYMPPMVPDDFRNVWKLGLQSSNYTLKLCGAGGGGFLLGFTENLETTRKIMHNKGIEFIPVVYYNENPFIR